MIEKQPILHQCFCPVQNQMLFLVSFGEGFFFSITSLTQRDTICREDTTQFETGEEQQNFTLFCSLQLWRSLSWRRRAAAAHCAASLRMRLFMKLSDSFPVPTCSIRVPTSNWKTACVKRRETTWSRFPHLHSDNRSEFFS